MTGHAVRSALRFSYPPGAPEHFCNLQNGGITADPAIRIAASSSSETFAPAPHFSSRTSRENEPSRNWYLAQDLNLKPTD